MELPTMSIVHRERVLLVGGQRALVLQLAHPKVAAGVARHSDFPARALERLRRTLDLTLATVYGTDDEATRATESIRAVHERVVGVAEEAGAYEANDPALLRWVNATLIDTTMLVYSRFVRPLGDDAWRRYYEEARGSAALLGLPRDAMPPDLDAFRAYVRGVIDGPDLRATEDSRRLVRDILRPPLPLTWRTPTAAARLLTLALLPARIRELFGLRAGPIPRLALATTSRASRVMLPFLPPAVRQFTAARAAPDR